MEIWTTTWLENPNGVKEEQVEQVLKSRNKSKKEVLWESQSGIQVGMLTLWVMSFETGNYNRVHQLYHFHQYRLASPYGEY